MKVTEYIENIIKEIPTLPKYDEISGGLQFTEEECEKEMGVVVGWLLLTEWERTVRIIKRKVDNETLYILRLRRGGINIETRAKELEEAKREFKEKTFEIKPPRKILKEIKRQAKAFEIKLVA